MTSLRTKYSVPFLELPGIGISLCVWTVGWLQFPTWSHSVPVEQLGPVTEPCP